MIKFKTDPVKSIKTRQNQSDLTNKHLAKEDLLDHKRLSKRFLMGTTRLYHPDQD
jgi:hypothetical protein